MALVPRSHGNLMQSVRWAHTVLFHICDDKAMAAGSQLQACAKLYDEDFQNPALLFSFVSLDGAGQMVDVAPCLMLGSLQARWYSWIFLSFRVVSSPDPFLHFFLTPRSHLNTKLFQERRKRNHRTCLSRIVCSYNFPKQKQPCTQMHACFTHFL